MFPSYPHFLFPRDPREASAVPGHPHGNNSIKYLLYTLVPKATIRHSLFSVKHPSFWVSLKNAGPLSPLGQREKMI